MKKLLLIASTTTALITSIASFAYADCDEGVVKRKHRVVKHKAPCEPVREVPCEPVTMPEPPCGEDGNYYTKIEGGVAFFDRLKTRTVIGEDVMRYRYKSKTSGVFGIGVGYRMPDNFHADLMFHYVVNPRYNKTFNTTLLGGDVAARARIKAHIWSVLANGYVDLFDLGCAKVVAGAGIGVAQVKEKPSLSFNGIAVGLPSKKRKTNFAYQLSLGAETKVADGVVGGLFYRWADYGKSKRKTFVDPLFGNVTYGKHHHKSHNVILSLRFDM